MRQVTMDRLRGVAVGAAVGDALGMPLEFGPAIPVDNLVREMTSGRMAAGSFTDDTEMALALGESLLRANPLDPADLAQRFVEWYLAGPPDVGIHTGHVLGLIAKGMPWLQASRQVPTAQPSSASNASRCSSTVRGSTSMEYSPPGTNTKLRLSMPMSSRKPSSDKKVGVPPPKCS